MSPELGRGVLAEFLHRGLAGHADRMGDNNALVSAEEVVTYVRARVAHWLERHKAPVIVPTRYGKAEDFILVTAPAQIPPDRAPATQEGSQQVAAGWSKLDTWRTGGAVHKAPRTLRELEEAVRRADRRWSGGGPTDDIENGLVTAMARLEEQRTALALRNYPVLSVGRARRRGIPQEEEIRKAMRLHLEPLGRPPAKKEEGPPKLVPIPEKPPEEPPYDGIVWATLQAIDNPPRPPTIDQLRLYVNLLKTLGTLPAHQEVALLVYFADAEDTIAYRKLWPAESPQVGLRAAMASWQAASADGRSFKRIEKPLSEANRVFREALLAFFIKDDSERARAVQRLRSLDDPYRLITELGRQHEKAMAEWEDAVVLLPAVADFAPENATARQELDETWTSVVRTATAVRKVLDTDADATALEGAAADLKTQLKRFRDLLRSAPADATTTEKRARLRLPIWTVADRIPRTTAVNTEALDLAVRTLAEDAPPLGNVVATRAGTDVQFKEFANRRMQRAHDLLGLAGAEAPDVGNTSEMRLALTSRLTERYERESSPAVRERFAWLIHPAELAALPGPSGGPPNDPGPEARRRAEREFAEWLVTDHLDPLAKSLRALEAEADKTQETAKTLAGELEKAIRDLRGYP